MKKREEMPLGQKLNRLFFQDRAFMYEGKKYLLVECDWKKLTATLLPETGKKEPVEMTFTPETIVDFVNELYPQLTRAEIKRADKELKVESSDWVKFTKNLSSTIYGARVGVEPKGMSAVELAAKMNVHPNVIHYYESGNRQPTLFNLFQLAKFTGGKLTIRIEQK